MFIAFMGARVAASVQTKIEGNAANFAKTDMKRLPKPLKYFMIGFVPYPSVNDYFKFIKLTDIDFYSPAAILGGFFLLT